MYLKTFFVWEGDDGEQMASAIDRKVNAWLQGQAVTVSLLSVSLSAYAPHAVFVTLVYQ